MPLPFTSAHKRGSVPNFLCKNKLEPAQTVQKSRTMLQSKHYLSSHPFRIVQGYGNGRFTKTGLIC